MWVFIAIGLVWAIGWVTAKHQTDKDNLIAQELALKPISIPTIDIAINSPKEYKMLIEYAQSLGVDCMMLRKDIHAVPDGVIRAPFQFRGMTVYLKRST